MGIRRIRVTFNSPKLRPESLGDKVKRARGSQVKETQLLGMSPVVAQVRLKKLLLFSFVQRLGLDDCYRCRQKITEVTELSIDHIKPWRNQSADLFWDLDNIAFSHTRCNAMCNSGYPRTRGPNYQRNRMLKRNASFRRKLGGK